MGERSCIPSDFSDDPVLARAREQIIGWPPFNTAAGVPCRRSTAKGSVACLNYLIARGEASREVDAQGVFWYRAL